MRLVLNTSFMRMALTELNNCNLKIFPKSTNISWCNQTLPLSKILENKKNVTKSRLGEAGRVSKNRGQKNKRENYLGFKGTRTEISFFFCSFVFCFVLCFIFCFCAFHDLKTWSPRFLIYSLKFLDKNKQLKFRVTHKYSC